MSKEIWSKDCLGIDNRHDPLRSGVYDPNLGVRILLTGINVFIDDVGRVNRLYGFTQVKGGSYHSLFDCGEYALGVTGTSLVTIEADFATSAIATVTQSARVSYVKVGGTIYYMNGYEKGMVSSRTYTAWTGESYVGPDTVKSFSDPPIGELIAINSGRMYIASKDIIWYSQPYAYSWYNLGANYWPFSSEVSIMAPVNDGMYVSDQNATYFVAGLNPKEATLTEVADYPAICGTEVKVPSYRILDGRYVGTSYIWCSPRGVCLGAPSGQFINLTDRRLVLPSALRGAAIYRDGYYICLLEE